ncbi:MAG: CBS domain-containing protein [SAR324 cluster bacterium]|nr:CBS domain-containing protein [SAR324 cluster bacterium]
MNLLTVAHRPAVEVAPDSSVMEAVEASLPARVGAVAVVEQGRIIGIFTERDVMTKVLPKRLDPDKTQVREVMTSPVITVPPTLHIDDVWNLMLEKHIRHLPISEDGRTVLGMLSIRNVLELLVQTLKENLKYMESYMGR